MILADGVIDARELETLYKIGTEQYGLTQTEITATIRNAGSSFIMPSTIAEKIRFLYNLAQIAYADNEIDKSERELLKRYISKMEFSEENIDSIADFLFESVKNNVSVDEIINQATK